ncbi:MAG: GTP cyclohydrolase I FolE2 [Polyangiaceae bacterium]|nr:GTP cyclohydrolase I FolE2 [Polyangiaceae bacterium]
MNIDQEAQHVLFKDLPDHAAEHDDRALAIDKVGIKDLSYPIQVLDRSNQVQHTIARVNLYVSLPHQFKGTHMSRFIEVLNARRGEVTIRNMPGILTDIQQRLEADDAHIELSFPYFVSKRAPVSGVESLMEYLCTFQASKRGSHVDFVLGVRVPVKSLCPCSKAISDRGAHNQRSLVDVEIRSSEFIWIEDVVSAVESCASAPLFALLKREDEKYVTELAYDNPKFVEDLVRDAIIALRQLDGVRWLRVAAENQESIHNHSAYAEIEWSVEEDAVVQEPLRFPARAEPEDLPFGAWLKQRRGARGFTQQDLADHLGVSAAHLSRVESGEKRLSEDSLQRAADLLGLDPLETSLRAGVVPADLLSVLARHPRELREWSRSRQAQRATRAATDAP